jgi:hypothetical protein
LLRDRKLHIFEHVPCNLPITLFDVCAQG